MISFSAGNLISELKEKDFGTGSLSTSLRVLRLASNSLTRLPQNAFKGLVALESLDVRDNSIMFIHDETFNMGPLALKSLDLSGNLLAKPPFQALGAYKELQLLDLSRNSITTPYDVHFQNFQDVNVTTLTGNPLMAIGPEAFKNARVKEIVVNYTNLWYLTQDSFDGLQADLTSLDLSFNNLTQLPRKLLERHERLHSLSLRGNRLDEIPTADQNGGFQYTLRSLDFGGERMPGIKTKADLKKMRNLRRLGFSLGGKQVLTQDALVGVSPAVLHLDLTKNRLKRIEPEAFKPVPTLKTLDLSDNMLEDLHVLTFAGLSQSLETLLMRRSLAKPASWPRKFFAGFTSLVTLDLRANGITHLDAEDFADMGSLKQINLDLNFISRLPAELFSPAHTPVIEVVSFKYNYLQEIPSMAFAKLDHLREVLLSENRIDVIEKKAFSDLDRIQYIDLSNNFNERLVDNVWQNLPRLELLSLKNNGMRDLNFDAMEQVGNLANFRFDVSENQLRNLTIPGEAPSWRNHFNVKFLNASRNEIVYVSDEFFDGVGNNLISLDLSHNSLAELRRSVAGKKPYLQLLNINHNAIKKIRRDATEGSWNLLEIHAANNIIEDIPEDFFRNKTRLRVVNLSGNKLTAAPPGLLDNNRLEVLLAANNLVDRFPDFSLKPMPTLRVLDVSGNKIEHIRATDIVSLRNLISLDVSDNRLEGLDAGVFGSFHRIRVLDLSGNPLLGDAFSPAMLENLEELEELSLADAGLENITLPTLNNLLSLNASGNELFELESQTLGQTPNLKQLDISRNNLTSLDSGGWMMIPFLRQLRASGNPVTVLQNSSLVGLQRLQLLDLRELPLEDLETGALAILPGLQVLLVSNYPEAGEEALGKALAGVSGLEKLVVDIIQDPKLGNMFPAAAPSTLRDLEISGKSLVSFKTSAFSGITSPALKITVKETNIEILPVQLFEHTGRVYSLQLDLRDTKLSHVGDPQRKPGSGSSYRVHPTWLDDLRIGGSSWRCDCGIGWMDDWLSSDREVPCKIGVDWYMTAPADCPSIVATFRSAKCRRDGKSVLRSFLDDMDCSEAATSGAAASVLVFAAAAAHLLLMGLHRA
ncbi:unnamed protein product [Notodromas monacha]|uniref:Disease resistance R13L4/SHOC-2-like LRR domain-containing protein n=1 Tax=Notodromas monacha TaxID=399045 RepID=A0A7R9BI99_9CRUS|nr:unnamed protein product [Notodromas monacha]CAG0915729.1 unnamed protein product [Notodromas monacha]